MSAQPQGNLVRKQFLVTQLNVEKLQRLAEQCGSSAAEIVRKAIDAYEPQDQDETESPELMELVSARLKDAIKATRRANRQVAQTLKALDTGSE
ncbi:MAG: hypothetical protein P8Z69_09325 [Acidihalobacter sp.]